MSESTELQRSIEALTRTVDQLRSELVRKDVYVADQQARDAVQSGIVDDVREAKAEIIAERVERKAEMAADKAERKREKERTEAQRAADRRLVFTSFALPLLLILIQLYIASQVGK